MAGDWRGDLKHDPVSPLLESGDEAVAHFARRDLLGEEGAAAAAGEGAAESSTAEAGWPGLRRILRGQQADGSWKGHATSSAGAAGAGTLVETWRQFRHLVDQYGLGRDHPAVAGAAEHLFTFQTGEGDIRGFLGNQYAPYYTGAILGLLETAGYADDPRVARGLEWLLEVRQADGGWVIGSPGWLGLPGLGWKDILALTADPERETLRAFDPSRPFSAAGTGMVLRAFAAHPEHRASATTLAAARLLASKLLRKDNWSWYGHPDNWVRFQFPFWWTNLVSALDTLARVGLPADDPDIGRGLGWLREHQEPDGLWRVSYSRLHKATETARTRETRLWVSLAICRVLKAFESTSSAGARPRRA